MGLSEFGAGQLEELVSRLLPCLGPQDAPSCNSPWRTSHTSANSFFHNKNGEDQVAWLDCVWRVAQFNPNIMRFKKSIILEVFLTHG